jgi:hypothetical protein
MMDYMLAHRWPSGQVRVVNSLCVRLQFSSHPSCTICLSCCALAVLLAVGVGQQLYRIDRDVAVAGNCRIKVRYGQRVDFG